MIRKIKTAIVLGAFFLLYGNAFTQNNSDSGIWDMLLTEYVTPEGVVNYDGLLKEKAKLTKYIDYLRKNPPASDWTETRKKAYWINTYNANTVWLILEHYPLKSIKNIKEMVKTAWEIRFIKTGGMKYSLNDVENNILRKEFNDPRIHFGLNCASFSCPKLHNRAMNADGIDNVLDKLAKEFINDKKRNEIKQKKVKISWLFEWYKEDFIKDGTLIDFLNKYSDVQIDKNAKIDFLEYDWKLNN